MKFSSAALLILICIPYSLCAAPPAKKKTWYEIASTDSFSFSLKAEPIRISEHDDEASTVVQFHDKKRNLIEYSEWRVSGTACRQGFGTLTTQNLDGSNRITNNYVQDGENATALVGSEICKEYLQVDRDKKAKAAACPAQIAEAHSALQQAESQSPSGSEAQDAANIAAASADLYVIEESCAGRL